MTDETTSVTRYERDSQRVTNAASNAAPHHTTPHHTTKNTSSRSEALTRARETVNRWQALALVVTELRPTWAEAAVWRAIVADDRSYATVAAAAVRAALDAEVRHPNGIRYVNADTRDTTPTPPSIAEQIAAGLLPPRREAS